MPHISPSVPGDVPTILRLYDLASEHMRKAGAVVVWPAFERALVETEVAEGRQYKLVVDGEVACVWVVALADADIWGQRERGDAVYVHRIATNPAFRGRGFVQRVTDWAAGFAHGRGLRYVRLDTMGENRKLIDVYTGAGFAFLGMHDVPDATHLPAHYREGQVALFELDVRD